MPDASGEEMEGIETSNDVLKDSPLMTSQERRILEVFDRLEELQLEIALLKAQGVLSQDDPEEVTENDVEAAQQDLLKAKALYQVRNNVVESVLIANPILKAVHAGTNASLAEQDLLPLIHQRDELSVTLSKLSARLLSTQNELTKTESENLVISRQNVELARNMLELAHQAKTQKGDITNAKARREMDELEEDMKVSRQRWRIMKGTAAATVVGSGVDWARDPQLLEMVLDNDGDDV